MLDKAQYEAIRDTVTAKLEATFINPDKEFVKSIISTSVDAAVLVL